MAKAKAKAKRSAPVPMKHRQAFASISCSRRWREIWEWSLEAVTVEEDGQAYQLLRNARTQLREMRSEHGNEIIDILLARGVRR